ncbi:MAG: hypothetical protein KDA89_19475 [Planctomycetaceae bacterium]|nr:hypothetical protein [Planctomycetaceae bacterium]
MFGFFRPDDRQVWWRQSYARICQTQRRLFGLTSLPFLSYEATLLYQLAIDFGLIPALPEAAPQCCRLRRLQDAEQQPDAVGARFSAAFGLLLAGIKLRDDVRDEGRWFHRLVWLKYRKQVHRAEQILEQLRPGLGGEVQRVLNAHRLLETSGHAVRLADFIRPTGDGFAQLFSAMAELLHGPTAEFAKIGRYVGQAIIAWDCAVDFERDRILGHFNPLHSTEEVRDAFELCLLELSRIGWALPADSVALQVVQGTVARVHRRLQGSQRVCPTTQLERWGLIRARGYQ